MLSYLKRRKQLDMSHPLTQESTEYNYAKHRVKISPVEASGTILLLTSRPYRHRGRGVGRASPSHTALSTDVGSASDGSGAATRPCQLRTEEPRGAGRCIQWRLISDHVCQRLTVWESVSQLEANTWRHMLSGLEHYQYGTRHMMPMPSSSLGVEWSEDTVHGSFLGKCWATHDVVQWSGDRRHSSKHMRINLSVYENILSALWQEILF
jgi:hypothetical protein